MNAAVGIAIFLRRLADGEFVASATTEYFTRRYATTNKMRLDFPGLKRPG